MLPILHKNKYKSFNGVNWYKAGTLFAVGAITSVIGMGMLRKMGGADIISKMIFAAMHEIKVSFILCGIKKEKPTFWGIVQAMLVSGAFLNGLKGVQRIASIAKHGKRGFWRYISLFR